MRLGSQTGTTWQKVDILERESRRGRFFDVEHRFVSPDGHPVLHGDSRTTYFALPRGDGIVTGRGSAEGESRPWEGEEGYRAMFDLAGLGVAQADPATGKILRVNPTLCGIIAYSEGELLGLTFFEITHPEEAIARI